MPLHPPILSTKLFHWPATVWAGMLLISISPADIGAKEQSNEGIPETVLELAPEKDNPRNSEGDLIKLKDGSLLLVYTHFTGGGADNSEAHLASRVSKDSGKTWSNQDEVVVPNEGGENVMSVSLLRLDQDRIALLYLRKNSQDDCRPVIRFSDDEAVSWSDPVEIIPESEIGYYVVNNDRLVRLSSGRLIVPASRHNSPQQEKFSGHGTLVCYFSDDLGATWKKSSSELDGNPPAGEKADRVLLQEPGIVEKKDGSLLMFARTNGGSQFFSTSTDGGDTWSQPEPSALLGPVSPATIERSPQTGQLVAIWNDHRGIDPELKGKRTPLSIAVSPDDGKTWKPSLTLFDQETGWYCYTALHWLENGDLLLAHCAGDRSKENGLARMQVTHVPFSWVSEGHH